jgi:serine/threonine protein kinase
LYNSHLLDSIAHYKILERVGESRLGEVFRARDTRLGRTIAIKIPPPAIQDDAAKREALLADARTAMRLSHPNIATLYEVGDDNGRIFLACEFVPGNSLDRVIAGHPLNARRAIDIAAQVADALADAHAVGFAHGDLTKDSIVVTPKGAAKTLDFGFARWTRADGTPGDQAGDLGSLRRLFFEMLTGKPPEGDAASPSSVNKSLPVEVDALVTKDYELAVTFAADLRAVAAILEVRAEKLDKTRGTLGRKAPRSKGPLVAIILAVIAAALTAAWWYFRR